MSKLRSFDNSSRLPICCFDVMVDRNDYLREFSKKYCSEYPNGFCHSKWKNFVPYLLLTHNDSHFDDFEARLSKDLFKKYERALFDYLIVREIDVWKKAYYLGEKPNFKKLCEFFCSKEEREWRSRYDGCCCDIPF